MSDANDQPPLRRLKIDLAELKFAFANASWEAEYYLDLETGEVILISSQITVGGEITKQMESLTDHARYRQVPQTSPREEFRDMERFIETVKSPTTRQLLKTAIDGKGAFKRFKNALLDHPQERERWFRFKEDRLEERIENWLEAEGVELEE